MFESKYNRFLTIILVIVILAILGLVGFLVYNYIQEVQSTKEASDFVDTFYEDDQVSKIEDDDKPVNTLEEGEKSEKDNSNNNTTKITKKKYQGFYVDGTIKIPKINLSYPVLEKMSVKALEKSVAILSGAGLNQVGNTVIVGHNYRNSQFFSNNKKLSNGDKIYIRDYQGGNKTYVIYNKFTTTPEDTSFYQRDTNGKAEITLSTCTDDSKARLIIFAKEE